MRAKLVWTWILAVTLVAFSSGRSWTQEMLSDGKKAFMVMPARLISDGLVLEFELSKSGKVISFQRQVVRTPSELVTGEKKVAPVVECYAHEVASGRTVRIRIDAESPKLTVMGDDLTGFVVDEAHPTVQGFVDLRTGVVTKTNLPVENIIGYGAASNMPNLLLRDSKENFELVSPLGWRKSFRLEPGLTINEQIESKNGNVRFWGWKLKPENHYYTVDFELATMSYKKTEVTKENFYAAVFEQAPQNLDLTTRQDGYAIWFPYEAENKEKLTPTERAELSRRISEAVPINISKSRPYGTATMPTSGKFVAFIQGGALMIRNIEPVDMKLYADDLKNKKTREAISAAKQVALGIILYAADMEDNFPGQEDFKDKVRPYLKNDEMVNKFVYTFKGGNMSQLENPAGTEIGYVTGPGGKAVAFADGHVKWVPDI